MHTFKKFFLVFAVLTLLSNLTLAATHSVTLSWGASPDAAANPTLTYNVYRASTGCNGAPAFVKVNAAPIASVTYVDAAVTVGNTYCYQITAALNALESLPSNSVQVQLPPSPPVGLTGTVQ